MDRRTPITSNLGARFIAERSQLDSGEADKGESSRSPARSCYRGRHLHQRAQLPAQGSAEQLEAWRALVERIRRGHRFEVVSWDELAAELGL